MIEHECEALSDVRALQRLAQPPGAGVNYEVGHRGANSRSDNEIDDSNQRFIRR